MLLGFEIISKHVFSLERLLGSYWKEKFPSVDQTFLCWSLPLVKILHSYNFNRSITIDLSIESSKRKRSNKKARSIMGLVWRKVTKEMIKCQKKCLDVWWEGRVSVIKSHVGRINKRERKAFTTNFHEHYNL